MSRAGRRPVGPEIKLALPQTMLDAIESSAAVLGKTRTELIRYLLDDALARLSSEDET